jgi:hypothetical protein
MRGFHPRVRRTRKGDFQLRLPEAERAVLRSLPGQLRQLLGSDDPAVSRLFPPAYPDDPERDAEYRSLVRDDLTSSKLRAAAVLEATVDARRLDRDQLTAWLGALNDARLVLGTRLGVREDLDPEQIPDDHPDAPAFALFYYLGWLEEQVVEALASGP